MAVTINGSAGVTTNSGAVYDSLQRATAVASTSGTAIEFTSIPSWARRITLMFSGMSTNGTSNLLFQIGSGSFITTGYASGYAYVAGSSGASNTNTTGFLLVQQAASAAYSGCLVLLNVTGNTWVASANYSNSVAGYGGVITGSLALSGVLDRVRITTVNGTDTFDAGTINIIYE